MDNINYDETIKLIHEIKCRIGEYEKHICDMNKIEKLNISKNIKNVAINEAEKILTNAMKVILHDVNKLPYAASCRCEKNNNIVESSSRGLQVVEMRETETKEEVAEENEYKKWRKYVGECTNYIYQRDITYVHSAEVQNSIYDYMNRNYGIVWEQELKEFKKIYRSRNTKMDIIFYNEKYKSIFESILKDMYEKIVIDHPDILTSAEIITELVNITNDKSKGGSATLRKIYEKMESDHKFNIEKAIKRCEIANGIIIQKKTDMLADKTFMEEFRISANELLSEAKGK